MLMKQLVMGVAIVMFVTRAAYGQETPASESRPAAPSASTTAPVSLADQSSHARFDADPPGVQPAADDPDEQGTWDNIKHGFFAGLVIGGLVGAVMVAECGHPECGPLLTLAAGVGGAIGLGIDALVDRRPDAAGVSAHGRAGRPLSSAGPRVMVRLRKSW
jgi:hypothetical protein